jgi:polyferredoxin
MRNFRRVVQTASLLLFLLLLSLAGIPGGPDAIPVSDLLSAEISWPVAVYLQSSPLLALSAIIASGTIPPGIWFAVVILASALLLGRVFCGWLCPMGALLHLFSLGRGPARREAAADQRRSESKQKRRTSGPLSWKYYLLLLLIPTSFFSLQLVGLFDPIALLTRSLGLGISPVYNAAGQETLDALYGLFGGTGPPRWLEALSTFAAARLFANIRPVYYQGPFIALLLILIVALCRQRFRFWCRHVCPLGALLGFTSKLSPLTLREKSGTCTDCGRCRRTCPAAASPWPAEQWKRSECYLCYNCVAECQEGTLSFAARWARPSPAVKKSVAPRQTRWIPDSAGDVNMTRRAVMTSLAAGAAAPLILLGGTSPDGIHPLLIRPPGALEEKKFLETCIRCGLCMKTCLTNAIQPTLLEARLEGLWTPRLVMKIGYCENNCTLCGQVCPTGAIENLPLPVKRKVHIGTAFIRPDRCLPYAFNRQCIVCEEHCPTGEKAIYFVEEEREGRNGSKWRLKLPRVDPKLCIGCGICEWVCPVRDRPAIYVTRIGESRGEESALLLGEESGDRLSDDYYGGDLGGRT